MVIKNFNSLTRLICYDESLAKIEKLTPSQREEIVIL
jgi:hypothetical protein